MNSITAPFRWAGSKAKLTSELFAYFKESETYIEPFLGSGVVLFRLIQEDKFKRYLVNDINQAIINFYIAVRDNPSRVVAQLSSIVFRYNSLPSMDHKSRYYYSNRATYNLFKADWTSFWLLMKTGYNGLYRENKSGQYNVPFGKKKKISFDADQIYMISDLIRNVTFYSMDYQKFLELVIKDINNSKGFVYNDPPYCNSQKYTSADFDNQALATYIKDLGFEAAISDVDNQSSNDTYKEYFKVFIKDTKRVINIASVHTEKEVLYINYKI